MTNEFKEEKDMKNESEENVEEIISEDNEDVNEEVIEETEDKSNEEFDKLRDNFIRLQADFANYKRRAEADKKEYVNMGAVKIASKILNVLDNFERAIEHSENDKDPFYEGIVMIKNQLVDVLKSEGIVEMEALHEKFDPNFHHAVLTEDSDEFEEDTVIEVLQKGYLINDKTLRPAMVKVSK